MKISMIKKSLSVAFTVSLLSVSVSSFAQSILFKDATVHTLTSQGTLQNTDVLVVDGAISAVGKDLSVNADKIVEAKGKTITPGIFAVANQLGIVEIGSLRQTADNSTNDDFIGASFEVDKVFNPNSTLIPHNRSKGVTRTLISTASSNTLLSGQGSIMSLKGDYDSLIRRNIAIFGTYGERGSNIAGGSRAAALKGLQQALTEARAYASNTDAIERGEFRELFHSIDDLKALQPLLNRDIPLVLTVNRASDMKTLIGFGKKNNIRLVFMGAAEAWMIGKDIAQAGIPVMLDPINNIPGSFESLGQRFENAAMLDKAGVSLIFLGPGFLSTHNAHGVRHSAGNAVAYGLPYQSALKAMTVNPARVFGGASNYGKIIAGYKAELVVWDGDPLEVTTHADYVVIDGNFTNMTSRADRLRDRYKDLEQDSNTHYRK